MRKPVEFNKYPALLGEQVRFGPYKAVVKRIVDADTFYMLIDLGFNLYPFVVIRLNGFNAPELSTPEGKAAKKFVSQLLTIGTHVLMYTLKDVQTFGRYVADIYYVDEGGIKANLGDTLVEAGHAVRLT